MPFDWTEIQNNWLYDLPVPYSKEELIHAFNQVERRLGAEFFNKYHWIRGQYFVTLVVDLYKIFEETDNGRCTLPAYGEVIRKIQSNNLYLASTIIRLASHYLRQGYSVEFEPRLQIRKRQRYPDLRVKINDAWVYIEESRLDFSLQFKQLTEMLNKMSKVLASITSNLNIDISLLKDGYSDEEVTWIIGKIKDIADVPSQPQDFMKDDFVQVISYRTGQEKPSIETRKPSLGVAALNVGPLYERHLNVQIPFTDVRINKVLKKRKQLSPHEPNMIILDISIPGNIEIWSESINKLLHSNKHRRIGAVLLLCKSRFIDSFKISSSLIEHSNPSNPLPKEFIQITKDCFKDSLEFILAQKNR